MSDEILCDHIVLMELKGIFYMLVIKPVFYGLECLAIKNESIQK